MKGGITINGRVYPVRKTMGALLRFKQETGKDVSEIEGIADMVILLWCLVASACAADKVPFDLSLQEFADALEPDDLDVLNDIFPAEDSKKKKG